MPGISRAEVAHLAKLARLQLSEEELELFAGQIDDIVANVAKVGEVATAGVVPMSHPHNIQTTMRPDVLEPSLSAEQALDQSPATEEQRFVVPQILSED